MVNPDSINLQFNYGAGIHASCPVLKLTGHSVTAARVLWEDLVPVQIWMPRKLIFSTGGGSVRFPVQAWVPRLRV